MIVKCSGGMVVVVVVVMMVVLVVVVVVREGNHVFLGYIKLGHWSGHEVMDVVFLFLSYSYDTEIHPHFPSCVFLPYFFPFLFSLSVVGMTNRNTHSSTASYSFPLSLFASRKIIKKSILI